ncbi:hypothetical protein Osc1_14000 [Hominimerdicola sp. 21CYCFAH17_S]
MDSLKFLLYTLARIGLLLASLALALVFGKIFFPIIASLVPESMNNLNNFFLSPVSGSVVAWLTMLVLLAVLFFDDGRRHAAYESWSSINVSIALILMFMVYFIPVIFRDSFSAEGKGRLFYEFYYFPCKWLNGLQGIDLTLSAALGIGLILIACLLMYILSYRLYVRKHPVILRRSESLQTDPDGAE